MKLDGVFVFEKIFGCPNILQGIIPFGDATIWIFRCERVSQITIRTVLQPSH